MFWRRKRNEADGNRRRTPSSRWSRGCCSRPMRWGWMPAYSIRMHAASRTGTCKDAHDWASLLPSTTTDDAAALLDEGDEADKRTEIVFLDAGVEDGQQLLADLHVTRRVSITQVHLIDANSDGVDQIAQVLAGQQGIDCHPLFLMALPGRSSSAAAHFRPAAWMAMPVN